jgi:hypothetical protein
MEKLKLPASERGVATNSAAPVATIATTHRIVFIYFFLSGRNGRRGWGFIQGRKTQPDALF